MAVNNVVVNGETILDLRNATATAADILEGATAYGASGELLTGTVTTGGEKKQITVSLSKSKWSSYTQKVSASGVTASNDVIVQADSGSADEWFDCDVQCTAQASGKLTFTCDRVPSQNLTATVTIINIG